MKPLLLLCLWGMLGVSCRKRTEPPKPLDILTTIWCDSSARAYQFAADGSFTMRNRAGQTWGGNWFYRQPLTDVAINLYYGPDRQIQHIRLRITERTTTRLTGTWSDEMITDLPIRWQPCASQPTN